MKMSDVFELPVSRDGFKLKDKCGVSQEMHVAKFADLSACVYAEFAINNHDRMADEIAELREFVSMVADGDECEESDKLLMAYCFIETAKQLLAKHK